VRELFDDELALIEQNLADAVTDLVT